ncbi:xylulokinase [Rhodobacter sp. HX-7-19]|uniref:Xylulose kinase n=1 Tax=Paragemmobacter kunshanensis TaxID=2583234 RepID=A0A6M1TP48_9RHOB|nr:xylulokinase [Rhodobacter kunshanensis]NGQ89600.1 xylulokinase [Rhodobacter kunshanensis]
MTLTIGIDLGTSGVKAVILQDAETVLADAAQPIAVSIPHVGWSEQEADDWVAAVWSCLDRLAATAPREMAAVSAIGLSGQMLCALLLDKSLKPLRPAILWNDQRSIAECAELLQRCPDIGSRTNGTPDPGITAPKLLWLAKHEPQVMRDARMLLLTKDYVRLALTGEVATEPTDAGGTQLMDCRTGEWDAQLCELAGWNPDHLPPVTSAWKAAGGLRPHLAQRWGMKPNIPVAAGAGDNMASTLGAGAARPGDAVLTIGTSGVACIVDATFHPGPQRAILTSAHAAPDTFLSMGVVMSATAALDWTARLSGTTAATLAGEAEAMDARKTDASPVFLPCLTGIRTPANRPQATGRLEGLHPGVDRAMMGYATMEGVAFQFADCIAAQREVGAIPQRFVAVGGGTRSALWTTLIATAIGEPVALPARSDIGGPAGAARLAAVAAGASTDVLSAPLPMRGTVDPDPALAQRLAPRKARFDALVESARRG